MDNFGVDSKDVKIRGIDPKSHGSFDRFMDRATRFLRIYGSKALIIFMLSGCNTGVIDVIVKTSEAGETSALSGDSTKTPESPTAVATEIPIITLAPEPTATATEIPTPTEIPEKYPIDLEKLVTPPKSYEEFKQHPEKFVQAPNPMENFEEFIEWYNETLFEKALGGDLDKLPVNYKVTRIGIGDRIMARNETEGEVLSVPKFFYFKDQNQLYPSYVVTLEYNGYIQSYTVVMRQSIIEMFGFYQSFVDISKGERDLYQLQLFLLTNELFSEGEKKVYDQGFGSYPSTISEIPIGFGTIFCFDD